MSEIAYKFTHAGARSPFVGAAWRFGEWITADGELEFCANGIHACRLEALPRWIDAELWRVEVDGLAGEREGVVLARRARLIERIERWNAETSRELARSCAARVRRLAEQQADPIIRIMADEIAVFAEGPDPSATALTMYCTAHAFEVASAGGYAAERGRQATWLRDTLLLERDGRGES